MKMLRSLPLILLAGLTACDDPEPRRPVQGKTDRFIEESVIRNRQLLAQEETRIKEIIEKDTLHEYLNSGSGFWYYYETKNDTGSGSIAENDAVTLSYMLASLNNDTLYSADDIGVLQVRVDKEALFPGLREGIKLLKSGEKATFLFPSALGYGYPGDQDRIGTNVPLKCSVSIIQVEKSKDSIL